MLRSMLYESLYTSCGMSFSQLNLGPVRIPLKFPAEFGEERTTLETLYLDDFVKVSRVGPYGERTTPGSLFIHVKKQDL